MEGKRVAKLAINGGNKAAEGLAEKVPVWPKATEEDKNSSPRGY